MATLFTFIPETIDIFSIALVLFIRAPLAFVLSCILAV